MKYTIEGFSQAKIVELKLDNTDALILRWFVDFLPKMTTVTHEGKNYQWVKYQAVIDDLPCIRISNREVIARRFNKFVDAGIMEKYINKEGGVFTCFALTNKYLILVEDAFNYKVDPSTLKYIPLDPKVDTPLDAKVDTKDPSIIRNSSIKCNKEKNIKKENLSIPDNFTEKETLLGHCPTNDGTLLDKRTPELEIELELEKNIKKADNKKPAPKVPQIPTNENEQLIAYYNQHSTIKAKLTDKTINNNLTKILKEHTITDVKLVIKYILNNKWYIDNGCTGLINITRPTKFSNKLETAQIALKNITIERLELKSKPIFTEFA